MYRKNALQKEILSLLNLIQNVSMLERILIGTR